MSATVDRQFDLYQKHERDWQNAGQCSPESEDALYGMVEALSSIVSAQQAEIDALIAHAQRPLAVPS